MSNTRGGMVVVGIDDKTGRLNPLSYKETQEVTALSGNSATDNVIPSILVDIENVPADGGVLVEATIKQGLNKPYHNARRYTSGESVNDECAASGLCPD